MSEQQRHKLYNHEVTPPPSAWEKIQAELSESWSETGFAKKLGEAAVVPDESNWHKIQRAVEEPELQGQWVERLQEMEVPPPITTWNHISLTLDETETVKPAAKNRILPLLRYMAAAMLGGLLVLGGLWLQQKTKNTSTAPTADISVIKGNKITDVSSDLHQLVQTEQNAATSQSLEEARNDAALEQSKHTFAKIDVPRIIRQRNLSGFSFAASPSVNSEPGEFVSSRFSDMTDAATSGAGTVASDSRYIVLMTPEGNTVRLSKKLGDWACSLSGDEVNSDCNRQLQQLKTQIACNTGTHAPDNFMDLISLINALKQE